MGTISLTIPTAGTTDFSTAASNVDTDLAIIQTWANGNVDPVNLSTTSAQSACVNLSGQTVKGVSNIATSQSTSSTTYTTLSTPDQISSVVLPSNGLIRVWYQATWQESVAGNARAAIFIGSNQLVIAADGAGTPQVQAAATGAAVAETLPLFSTPVGLASMYVSAYTDSQATTGQAVGWLGGIVNTNAKCQIGGTIATLPIAMGGPCDIFAAAGTYTVSVQFKVSSGSVTASNRKLWVQALSFS